MYQKATSKHDVFVCLYQIIPVKNYKIKFETRNKILPMSQSLCRDTKNTAMHTKYKIIDIVYLN